LLVPEEGVVAARSLREVDLRSPRGTYLSAGTFPRTLPAARFARWPSAPAGA